MTKIKIGPVENIIGEKVTGYAYTPVNEIKKTNDNLVLNFKSGKKLFVSSLMAKDKSASCLFFSPEDENDSH